MKKFVCLIVALIVVFSHTACSKEIPEDTTAPIEETLPIAEPLDANELFDVFINNQIKGEDTYYQNYYELSGTVASITSHNVVLLIEDTGYSSDFVSYCIVELPREEVKNFEISDMITITGKINKFEKVSTGYSIFMSNGHYIGNSIEIKGKISDVRFSENTSAAYAEIEKLVFSKTDVTGTNLLMVTQHFYIELPDMQKSFSKDDLFEIGKTTVKIGDEVIIQGKIRIDKNNVTRFHVFELDSITKAQSNG